MGRKGIEFSAEELTGSVEAFAAHVQGKNKMALRTRTETTVTVDWIAQRLHMGTRGHLAHLLYLQEHSRLKPPSSAQPTLNL